MIPTVYRVSERSVEYPGTFTLKLEVGNPEPDKLPMRFAPGQFNMLYAFGVGESAISFSGLGSGDGKLIHTIRAQGNVTRALERLRAGTPWGFGGLSESAGRYMPRSVKRF